MPAEKAGMKDGDLLLAVNGDDVTELDHQAVVLRIRAGRDHVTLLVIDAEGSKFYHLVRACLRIGGPQEGGLLSKDSKQRTLSPEN